MFRELFSSDLPYYILDKIEMTEEDFLSEIQHNVVDFSNYEGTITLSNKPACCLHLTIQDSKVLLAKLELKGEATVDIAKDLDTIFFSGYETRQPLGETDFLDPESEEFKSRALKSELTTLLESGKIRKPKANV